MSVEDKSRLITIASANEDKIAEIKEIINFEGLAWQTMGQAGFQGQIDENGSSYRENALIKARAVHQAIGGWVLADDSGLSVDLLDGAPGIYSARFAGPEADYPAKIARLHELLAPWPQDQWTASFVCALALIAPDAKEWVLEAAVKGRISDRPQGSNGFGYDPIFYLDEYGCTTAQMSSQEKHAISHRGAALRALAQLIDKEKVFHD